MKTYLKTRIEAIADPTRLAILEALARSALAVVDLAALFPISRPAVSQHLRVLKDAGLVLTASDGRKSVYRADPDGLAELREQFDKMWNSAASSSRTTDESGSTTEKEKKHGKKGHRSRKKKDRS